MGKQKTRPTKATRENKNMETSQVNHQSEALDKLAPALAAAQASLSSAKKDSLNPHFRNQYASLQSIWDAAREVLAPNGLSVIQTFEQSDGTCLNLRTLLLHNSGQWVAGTISLQPVKPDPQQMGSAATYARRYSLSAILGIVADDDDDGEASSHAPSEHTTYAKAISTPARANPAPEPQKPAKAKETALSGVSSNAAEAPPVDWKSVIVPPFIKKYAGQTLGDMLPADLAWWASNYTPRPYKGAISPKDVAFKEALTAGLASLTLEQAEGGDVPY